VRDSDRLRIQVFTVNPFAENTYILSSGKKAVVVDPGMSSPAEWTSVLRYVERESLDIEAIWLTHAHIDHILGVEKAVGMWGVPVWAHPAVADVAAAARPLLELWGMPPITLAPPDRPLAEGDRLSLGAYQWAVREAPGHSPDHLIFYEPTTQTLIAGDVLFKGSIGRTDLPGGDYAQLMASIQEKVLTLPDPTVVWPGHGPSTTVGAERQTNPFILEYHGHGI